MQFITTLEAMRDYSRRARAEGKTIGFVPTMGYLHDGHMSLARAARKECDTVVMSIFVNPTQFVPGEDFDRYPRDMERDRRLAEEAGVDVVFAPSVDAMYPDGYATHIETTGALTQTLCGSSRPGHFKGVTTVVAKLFDITCPDKSYFGQKDAQQAVVVKRMTRDLNMPVEIRVMPIVRETDGLAMSSRNTYLSGDQRRQAQALSRSLKKSEDMIAGGEFSAGRIKEGIVKILQEEKDIKIDYVAVVDADRLTELETVRDNTLIAIAAFVGQTRLIDNTVIEKVGL
ncbi:MAG: pantoate--beta-alanine ligase [Candidatus Omnitrophota bacterium]